MYTYSPPALSTPIPILYEDEECIIVDKPSGLLSVPGRGAGMEDCLLSRLADKAPRGAAVHRLDIETSGLIIIARYRDALRAFSTLFQTRQIEKTYHAWVAGSVQQDNGEETGPLMTDWPNRPKQKIDHQNGKPSRTGWYVLERKTDRTSLQLTPHTGRTHQLRVHMAAMGHPILGDGLYADKASAKAAPRLLLHASRLRFVHPISQREIDVTSAPPF